IPLDGGADALGSAGAHMLDVGLSSTARIAGFFGIAPEGAADGRPAAARLAGRPARPAAAPALPPETAGGVQQVIEDALRKAGLMR
ncbi:MAG TPA: hypothetical protein VF547_03205, partial [Allosphingosinicella sp.]